jgi:hypothetical protein
VLGEGSGRARERYARSVTTAQRRGGPRRPRGCRARRPHRPPLPRDAPPLPASTTSGGLLGARFWGQVRGFPGRLEVFQGRGRASRETTRIAGKARNQALFRDQIAAGRILHGKEGVDGSSPSEGFTKGQQMAFFVASIAYEHRSSVPQPVPKICPRHVGALRSWLEQRHVTSSSTAVKGRCSAVTGVVGEPANGSTKPNPQLPIRTRTVAELWGEIWGQICARDMCVGRAHRRSVVRPRHLQGAPAA